jgi:hypothetical protein
VIKILTLKKVEQVTFTVEHKMKPEENLKNVIYFVYGLLAVCIVKTVLATGQPFISSGPGGARFC